MHKDTMRIGAFEAKTHLSALLDRVAQGEEIVITKRGVPVARLMPENKVQQTERLSAISALKEGRRGMKLGGLDWKKLRDEGRR